MQSAVSSFGQKPSQKLYVKDLFICFVNDYYWSHCGSGWNQQKFANIYTRLTLKFEHKVGQKSVVTEVQTVREIKRFFLANKHLQIIQKAQEMWRKSMKYIFQLIYELVWGRSNAKYFIFVTKHLVTACNLARGQKLSGSKWRESLIPEPVDGQIGREVLEWRIEPITLKHHEKPNAAHQNDSSWPFCVSIIDKLSMAEGFCELNGLIFNWKTRK